ncbi:type II CAAX prenyl endopeptidase Rce1 family protein [Brachybacterium sacelli]|uniref:Membrane protease YdiL (CAAX protease family) n=1 Tax=Brachybacterium sacelli TaxID=173364 RepID=A0ABS4WXN5_9MICO|nr:CPBP family intramembrane glutamic endopeptidase [Brachybacterium sacelli]MBP2380274.1 membrane protease YdiL (CAAX protease family) [Brachybacterium sacelli]
MSLFPAAAPAASSGSLTTADLRRVALFLVLATAVSTGLSVPLATGRLPLTAVGLVVPLAQLSPLLAALLVRRRDEPWRRSLALTVPSWAALGVAGLGAIAAFVLVPLARILIGLGAGAPPAADAAPVLALVLAVPMVFAMQAAFAIGEETGWRGWLHRELAPLGFWSMSLVIGMMWALWHLPIVFALGLAPREAVTYLGTIVAVAPLLSALREISGTAWAAVIGHGLFSSARVAIEQNVLGTVDPALAWLLDLSSWALWIAVGWMVLRVAGGIGPVPDPQPRARRGLSVRRLGA